MAKSCSCSQLASCSRCPLSLQPQLKPDFPASAAVWGAGPHTQALGTQTLRHRAPFLQDEVASVADLDPAIRSKVLHRKPQGLGVTMWNSPELALSPSSSGRGGTDAPYWSVSVTVSNFCCISPPTRQPEMVGLICILVPRDLAAASCPFPW